MNAHARLIAKALDHTPRPDWRLDAACQTLTDFSELTDAFCETCLVRLDCLADALEVERQLPLVQVLLQRAVPAAARATYFREALHT